MTIIGFGARAMLGQGAEEAVGKGGNIAAPLLAQSLGGGDGTTGGDIALALFSRRGVRDDPRGRRRARDRLGGRDRARPVANVLRPRVRGGRAQRGARSPRSASASWRSSPRCAIGSGFNVTVLVSMAFVFAASANFPPLLLALLWRRFNTTGALTGIAFGIVASVVMIVLSPPVWPGPDSQGSPSSLTLPGPRDDPDRLPRLLAGHDAQPPRGATDEHTYDELLVRSETGIGAEGGPGARPVRRFQRERELPWTVR